MRLMVVTDLVVDVLLDREPFAETAARVLGKVERGEASGYLCDTTVTVVHGIASRLVGAKRAAKEVQKLLMLFEIAPVNRLVLEAALVDKVVDFQNAVIYEAAVHIGAEALVTRREHEFAGAEIPVYSPDKLLKAMSQRGRAHVQKWG